METNHQIVKKHLTLKNAQIFHNCLNSLVKHWSMKVSKTNLVINLDYSFKIEATPVKPAVNQTLPMAMCYRVHVFLMLTEEWL